MKKTYRFNEKKSVRVMQMITIFAFLITLIIVPIIVVIMHFTIGTDLIYAIGIFLAILPCLIPFILLSTFLSNQNEFTRKFLHEIRLELFIANNLDKLYVVKEKLWHEATDENKMIRLSFPQSIKDLMHEIEHKIEILEEVNLNQK